MVPTKEELLMSIKGNVLATYLGSVDPALTDYYPAWVDNLADDATVEGSLLDGAVQGAEAVQGLGERPGRHVLARLAAQFRRTGWADALPRAERVLEGGA